MKKLMAISFLLPIVAYALATVYSNDEEMELRAGISAID
jgi:hypothetical protein